MRHNGNGRSGRWPMLCQCLVHRNTHWATVWVGGTRIKYGSEEAIQHSPWRNNVLPRRMKLLAIPDKRRLSLAMVMVLLSRFITGVLVNLWLDRSRESGQGMFLAGEGHMKVTISNILARDSPHNRVIFLLYESANLTWLLGKLSRVSDTEVSREVCSPSYIQPGSS